MASNNAGNKHGQDEGDAVAASDAPPGSHGGIVETVKTVVYAVLIALVVRTVAYEPFNIPSGSMIPTLLVGDYLFVSKFSYGYSRYSIPFNPPLFKGRVLADPPERGDVAVFKLPSDNSTDYIKRVIGLPGDRIRVERGILFLNGTQVNRRRVGDYSLMTRSGVAFPVPRYVETLPNGKSYYVIEADHDNGSLDNTKEFTVPEDHYFMMGDNRDNSLDSRAPAVGFVPFVNYVGRAEILFFSAKCDPSNKCAARIWEVWKWPFAIRYGRLFNGID